jgi:type IV secretory pathway VirB2 component (pilin)
MWEQYKKTFAKTQAVIAIVTLGTYFYVGHMAARSAAFFVIMQLGAAVGAMWGTRLKNKVDRQAW